MTFERTAIKIMVILSLIGVMILFYQTTSFAGPKAVQIGEVDCIKRIMQGNDKIKVIRVDDPENPFVSIYFTNIDSGKWMAMADPSNTSIAARLTGDIPVDENGKRIINTSTNTNIASLSQSIGTKIMKIARFYDVQKDTLVYLVYTTKLLDGSLKHSMSVVPLGKPLAPK
jgi:CreA protein